MDEVIFRVLWMNIEGKEERVIGAAPLASGAERGTAAGPGIYQRWGKKVKKGAAVGGCTR
jgi:hypothetical protein